MTQKELLYIEDALGHEEQSKTSCKGLASQIKDKELKTFVNELAEKHTECFGKFYSLLG